MAAVVYQVFPTLGVVKAHLIVNCVLCFFAYTVVALRIFSRISSGAKLGLDDLFVVLAVVGSIQMNIRSIIAILLTFSAL